MKGLNSQGSYIKHSDNSSPSVFAKIEKVKDINGPDGSAQLIDDSDLESTAKEYLAGLADFGHLTLSCGFVAGTEQMKMKTMYDTGADPEQFHLFIPTDSTKTTFYAFGFLAACDSWKLGASVNNSVKLDIGLKVSGAVTYLGTGLT